MRNTWLHQRGPFLPLFQTEPSRTHATLVLNPRCRMPHSPFVAIISRSRSRLASLLAIAVFSANCTGCSQPTPAEALVGTWAGDTSRLGTVARAMQLKQDAPDASSSMLIAGARVMGAIALTLAVDGKFEAVWMGKNWRGEWLFDDKRQELRLMFEPADAEPGAAQEAADAAKNSDPAIPTEWIGVLDMETRELEVFMFGRGSVDAMKAMEKIEGKRIKGLRLTKRSTKGS